MDQQLEALPTIGRSGYSELLPLPLYLKNGVVQDHARAMYAGSNSCNVLRPPYAYTAGTPSTSIEDLSATAVYGSKDLVPSLNYNKEHLQLREQNSHSQQRVSYGQMLDASGGTEFLSHIATDWSSLSELEQIHGVVQQLQSFLSAQIPIDTTRWPLGIISAIPNEPTTIFSSFLPDPSQASGEVGSVHDTVSVDLVTDSSGTTSSSAGNTLPSSQGISLPGTIIPQRRYQFRKSNSISGRTTITFIMENGNGFPVKDALAKKYTGLLERDDKMLLIQEGSSISIRIEWPGYKSWSRQVKTRNWRKVPQPINRSKLGTEVAKSLKSFIDKMCAKSVNRGNGFWKVGLIGSERISTDKLALVAIERVSRGSWQPVFCLMD